MMKTAFIIGNGVSRKPIDLNTLVGKGAIFGCNALYREFDKFDYLISIDKQFQKLIENPDERFIFPPEDECWESAEYRQGFRKRSNAGMNAMLEAIRRGHDKLYCLGFDFLVREEDLSTDNIFRDTEGYGPDTHTRYEDNINRLKYLEWFCNKNRKVKFVFVLPEDKKYHSMIAPNATGLHVQKFISKHA